MGGVPGEGEGEQGQQIYQAKLFVGLNFQLKHSLTPRFDLHE